MATPDDPQQFVTERILVPPKSLGRPEEPTVVGDALRQGTTDALKNTIDPVLARKEKKMRELQEKREAGEIGPLDFDLNFIFQLNEAGLPLTRNDMGNQALILSPEDFNILGCLDFIHVSGERMVIEAESLDPKDVFILYPNEVGE